MYCKYCGKEIPESSKFCRYCEKSLPSEDKPEASKINDEIINKQHKEVEYAGFWIRVGAYLLDLGIMLFALFVLIMVTGFTWSTEADMIISYLSISAYHFFFLSLWSSTPGKMLYRLSVIDASSGEKITAKKSLVRALSYIISNLPFGLGFLSIGWDGKKQGWHDKIAKTLVVRKKKKLLIPFLLTIISSIFITWLIISSYSEGYSYLPAQSERIFEAVDEFLLGKPENFQELLSSASSKDQDYEITISESSTARAPEEIVEQYGNAVVLVATDVAFGSGFIIHSDGIVMTNYHVVEDASKVAVTLTSGENYLVTSVIDYDRGKDIILLKIEGEGFPTVPIGNSDKIKTAEEIIVIGNPEGLNNSVSKGIISSIDREFEGINYIQVDAPISGGSSGGPIVNNRGEAIAISTFYYAEGQNLNFGLPINVIFDLELGNIFKGQVIRGTSSLPQVKSEKDLLASNQENLPIFDPEIYSCRDMPALAKTVNSDGRDVSWQTSAPRSVLAKTFLGDIVEIGLRNKYGVDEDVFFYTVRVQNPDGSAATSQNTVVADEWSDLLYPDDFPTGGTNLKGIYTILYQIRGEIIVCDGFVID